MFWLFAFAGETRACWSAVNHGAVIVVETPGRLHEPSVYGDNLSVLRDSIPDASVDLIYLDPPFSCNASYNVLSKGPQGADSAAQIEAFDDTWHWNDSAEAALTASV